MARTHFFQGTGLFDYARDLAGERPLRAPHHTVGDLALVSELALAASGVLVLDEFVHLPRGALRVAMRTWERMATEAQPELVLGFPGGLPLDGATVGLLMRSLESAAPLLPPIDVHVFR